ncbi:alpha/beta hydrolase [Ramlibacter sp. PS4R-6]|uniref:alpha/beta hydrolase n=1 Tax=Ramlibacter sp. PS4R-6 TaxID=3133438 RepID=UPI0030AA8D05
MLVFTNRTVEGGAFSAAFAPGGERIAAAQVKPSGGGWKLSDVDDDIDEKDALDRLLPLFRGDKPLLLYVHGNNNTPEACFGRLAELEDLYGSRVEVVGFSWPSEGFLSDGSALPGLSKKGAGDETSLKDVDEANRTEGAIASKIRRYHQAQTNGKDSIDAFARTMRLLGTARLHANAQPYSMAIHSLGNHMFQYSLQVAGATESAGTAHNIVMLAPCVRAASHADWVTRFRPKGRTYITYNQGDTVLFGAYIADGEQMKLGMDPGAELVRWEGVRYISFTNAANGAGGHGYFVKNVKGKKKELFRRIFGSQRDFELAEEPRVVYPVGCDADGSVCYMNAPDKPDAG